MGTGDGDGDGVRKCEVLAVDVNTVVVREPAVFRASGGSIIVRGPKNLQMFSPGDVERRGITILKDGRRVEFSDLREGDRLTATIVTEGTPKVCRNHCADSTRRSFIVWPR